jgi:hypothetical protein
MSTFIRSVYEAPSGYDQIKIQSYDELLVHPGHDYKKGVTIAAGTPCLSAGDALSQITTGPNMGKFQKRNAPDPVSCIVARPVAMASYDPNNPTVNNILDLDFAVDAIFRGIVKASMVSGINSADYAALGIIDMRPAQDAMILRW